MSVSEIELKQQLESLQGELSTRRSTEHFARAGVAIMAALVVGGAAGKLAWDSYRYWWIGALVGLFAVAVWTYGLFQYRRGKRQLSSELERFERLKSIREALRLDDPGALLPP